MLGPAPMRIARPEGAIFVEKFRMSWLNFGFC